MVNQDFSHLMGWDAELAKEQFDLLGHNIPKFEIQNQTTDYRGKRMMLYEIVRKVLGQDTLNYPQLGGSCVSFSCKNVMEYLQCSEIFLNNEAEKFRPIFPPYLYGTGRVLVGKGRLGRQDGSVGVWQQQACREYGVLASDEKNVPKYDRDVEYSWGYKGPPQEFVNVAKLHLVKTTAQVKSVEDLANGILNGYPGEICSNVGFSMTPRSDGFNSFSTYWNHALTAIGFCDDPKRGLYFIILNSWGNVHSNVKDFDSDSYLPIGCLRVRGEIVEKMLRQDDSYIYSQFDGFPETELHSKHFMLI